METKYKMLFIVVINNHQITKFMQAAGMFEAGKVIGESISCTLFYKEEVTPEIAQKSFDNLYTAATEFGFQPIIMYLDSWDNDGVICKNKIVQPFVDKTVRIISNGKKWFLVVYFLESLGFTVKTDNFRYITECSL